jgi:hypothetical protein
LRLVAEGLVRDVGTRAGAVRFTPVIQWVIGIPMQECAASFLSADWLTKSPWFFHVESVIAPSVDVMANPPCRDVPSG